MKSSKVKKKLEKVREIGGIISMIATAGIVVTTIFMKIKGK